MPLNAHITVEIVERRQVDKDLIAIRDSQTGAGAARRLDVLGVELEDTVIVPPTAASLRPPAREISCVRFVGRSSVYTPGTPTCPWTIACVPKVVTSTSTWGSVTI